MIIHDWFFQLDGLNLPCQAPCTMYSVLFGHGKIPDPFYGLNERELQHLGEKDCSFAAEFTVDETLLTREYIELTLSGIDTLCTIYLNGKRLARTKNMHRTYVFDVKNRLIPGKNRLKLEFSSPMRYFAEAQRRHYLFMNDGDTLPGTAHLRKAMYQSGWDWGPTLPDMGILRPVELKGYDTDRLDHVLVSQRHHDGVVDVDLRVTTAKNSNCDLVALLDGKELRLTEGEGTIRVEAPRLWWVRGYGEQALYDLEVRMCAGGLVIDSRKLRIGLRTLTVSTAKDADGRGSEFCFVLNGIKIFSMGANYVPMDNLLTRVTRDRQEQLVRQAVDANFNTLRVWGGGYYPEDDFYDLCDEYGLLVWQDFMVACANIWMTSEMETEFTCEATDNLCRLQHHASLGLLCGNNEMEDMILGGAQNNELVRQDYLRLYEHLLPELCHEYAPDTFYWPSSPSSGGGFDEPGRFSRGDTHYWKVWHGGVPFTAYRQEHFRFCSEYGFESFPSMKTIRSFCEKEDENCFSRVMENHQKCKGGNGNILRYLSNNYLYPSKFEDLVYASQLLQADAIAYGVEHFRRERGYCMGSIYWQFNDCWPVASWSSVDYFGRYKALHYAARRFYAPVAMGLFAENGKLTVNIANETREKFRGRVRLTLCRADLTELDRRECAVEVALLHSSDVLNYELPEFDPYSCYLAADLFDEQGNFLTRRVETLVPAKHFTWQKPTLCAEFTDRDGGVEIAVSSDVFTKGVFIDFRDFDCVLSDNFFALTDKAPYRVFARTGKTAAELRENAVFKTVYDIR